MASFPKVIHFIWFGPYWDRTKDLAVNGVILDEKDEKRRLFQEEMVKNGVTKNTGAGGYTARLYIDAFMLFEPMKFEIMRQKLKAALYSGEKKLVDDTIAANLEARKNVFTPDGRSIKPELVAKKNLDFDYFVEFCNRNHIELHFIDRIYIDNGEAIKQGAPHANPVHGHFLWYSLFESARITKLKGSRPNFGAASDVLRLHILTTEGGVYCDHDVKFFQAFGDLKSKVGFRHGTTSPDNIKGEAYAVPTNAILAAHAGDSPLLLYRNAIIKTYENVFATQKSLSDYYDAEPNKLRDETIRNTGPSALQAMINTNDEVMKQKEERRIRWEIAQAVSAGAWLDIEERNINAFKK